MQVLLVYDITRVAGNDLITGDAQGMVSVLNDRQVLAEESCTGAITALCTATDAGISMPFCLPHITVDNIAVIVGDANGCVVAFEPHRRLWRLRIDDVHIPRVRSQAVVCIADGTVDEHTAVLADSNTRIVCRLCL